MEDEIVDVNGGAIPSGSSALELADQFAFLAIGSDGGKPLRLEASPQCANVLELLIAVGTGIVGDLLAVDALRAIHLLQPVATVLAETGMSMAPTTSAIYSAVLRVRFNP